VSSSSVLWQLRCRGFVWKHNCIFWPDPYSHIRTFSSYSLDITSFAFQTHPLVYDTHSFGFAAHFHDLFSINGAYNGLFPQMELNSGLQKRFKLLSRFTYSNFVFTSYKLPWPIPVVRMWNKLVKLFKATNYW